MAKKSSPPPKTKTKVKAADVSADKPSKKSTGKSLVIVPSARDMAAYGSSDPATEAFNSLLSAQFDTLEKKYEMTGAATRSLDKISSDSLVCDLVTGGGFTPTGINQLAGGEGSAKTTTTFHTLGRALSDRSASMIHFNDPENTFDQDYVSNIFGPKFDAMLLERLRYADQNILESYFDFIRGIIRTLPDKVWNDDIGSFVYRINNKVPEQVALREVAQSRGIKPDPKLSNKEFTIIPSLTSTPQALFILDSIPALITDKSDDRESDEGGGMSEKARVMAEVLPKTAGRFRRKGVVALFINQLREKPGVMYGSPIYEPGGNTLKFYSAQRTWTTTRVPPNDTFKKDKEATQLNVEDNPLGGKDYYSFKEYKNVKNKAGTPFLRGWFRVWTADPDGNGHGIDPVFDLWEYLSMTGQVEGKRVSAKGFRLLLPGASKNLGSDAPLNWHTFKLLVLAEKYGGKYLKAAKEAGYSKPPRLLELAWQQRGPKASQLRAERTKAIADGRAEKDEMKEAA
jgi:RecA/RadA recombinase